MHAVHAKHDAVEGNGGYLIGNYTGSRTQYIFSHSCQYCSIGSDFGSVVVSADTGDPPQNPG